MFVADGVSGSPFAPTLSAACREAVNSRHPKDIRLSGKVFEAANEENKKKKKKTTKMGGRRKSNFFVFVQSDIGHKSLCESNEIVDGNSPLPVLMPCSQEHDSRLRKKVWEELFTLEEKRVKKTTVELQRGSLQYPL